MKKQKISLTIQIFIALIFAIITGLFMQDCSYIAVKYIKPFGTIFLNLVKFVVVPVVLFSMLDGIISISDIKKVGSIGLKTIVYFVLTTALAILTGIVVAGLFKNSFPLVSASQDVSVNVNSVSITDTLINIFPSNIIVPLSSDNMLQVIVIAVILGIAIIRVGEAAKPVVRFIESINQIFIKCMEMIITLSPIGIFCLLCPVLAENGAAIIGSLAMVILAAFISYILYGTVVYSSSVKLIANMSPLKFFKEVFPAAMFAFSSTSSIGTLPVTIQCVKKMGVKDEISSFVLPLGATVNMDGTAIYQGVCAVFIASCYGVELSLSQIVTIIITATLASVGTAGVPGAGMIMLSMVLVSVGIPVEGIALVAGVDRLFDMGRTAINVTGDASCAVVVGALDKRRDNKVRSDKK